MGISVKRQGVRRNQQPVAQLGDAEAMIGQSLVAVKKRPARRSNFIVVALRRCIHAELGRSITKMVARPVAQAALHGLENAVPRRSPLRPSPGKSPLGCERLVLVIRVVRRDPGARQADLKIRDRLIDQRPDRGIEPHPRAVLGPRRRPGCRESDVSMKPSRMRGDLVTLTVHSFLRFLRRACR